jgi:hypothetical protein
LKFEKGYEKYKKANSAYANDTIAQLFVLPSEMILKNDNHEKAPEDVIPFSEDNNALHESRLVTFKQLYDFNNLFLNKSYLRKRVKSTEDHLDSVQKELDGLQAWKIDLEARYK